MSELYSAYNQVLSLQSFHLKSKWVGVPARPAPTYRIVLLEAQPLEHPYKPTQMRWQEKRVITGYEDLSVALQLLKLCMEECRCGWVEDLVAGAFVNPKMVIHRGSL